MKKKFTVDRTGSDVVVFIGERGDVLELSKELFAVQVSEGDICSISFDIDGRFVSLEKCEAETLSKKAEMSSRLSRLFKN